MIARQNLLVSVLLLWTGIATAQQGGDLQAQILYAYQTEDNNSLANLVKSLSTSSQADAGDASLRYHLAHAEYRRGLLAVAGHSADASGAFSDCVDQLKPLVFADVKSAEALTLQSACYFGLADQKKLEGSLLRSRAEERLKGALKLAPHNPRAVFLSSIEALRQAKPGSADQQHAFAQLQQAVQLFDSSSATSIETPGWGHAEAYLALGLELKARGDQLGARNLIEKSLIVAPDYKAAQRQLALLVQR
jgi:hypothetical protein